MLEFFNSSIVWWHWIVFGLVLIISEITTGTFITLGFGIAALIVGLLDIFKPLGFVTQLALWIVLGSLVVAGLFKWFKKRENLSIVGQSNNGFDTEGSVAEAIHPHSRGKVVFDLPVLGTTKWNAISQYDIQVGSRVAIVEIKGQLVEVKPLK